MNSFRFIVALTLLLALPGAHAGVAIVVHPSAGFDALSGDEVARIFLGKSKRLPDGKQAVPLNQDAGNSARDFFRENVLNKSQSQYDAYWAKLAFTGKGTPPKNAGNDQAIKKLVADNPNLIGYIDSGSVDSSVKVVFTLN